MDIIFSAFGVISYFHQPFILPTWFWFTMAVIVLLLAQFLAFHDVRGQRDQARQRLEKEHDPMTVKAKIDHEHRLIKVLEENKSFETLPNGNDQLTSLLYWWQGTFDVCPIPGGRICTDGVRVRVVLNVEERGDWRFLTQHLQDTPFSTALEQWKSAMVQDMASRRALYEAIVEQVKAGVGLPVIQDIDRYEGQPPCVTSYYVRTIYNQVFFKVLGFRLGPKEPSEFFNRSPFTLELGATTVIRAGDAGQAERAKLYLLDAQTKLVDLSESQQVARACGDAKAQTEKLNREIDKVLSGCKLPGSSRCEACPD